MPNDIQTLDTVHNSVAVNTVQATPADMVMYAMKNGGSIEQIREFMMLKREWEAEEAEKAFTAAKAAFKAEGVIVTKDKENLQYKSRYTSLGNLVNTVAPVLSKHGLSADWKIDQTEGMVVTCILSHSMGHTDSVSFKVPPDGAGAKNPIQQLKSAITYAKSVTFESVCGLASTDANLDDDGNGAGNTDLADKWIGKAKAAPNEADLKKIWTSGVDEITAANDLAAFMDLKAVVTARQAEFGGAAKPSGATSRMDGIVGKHKQQAGE